MRNSIERKRISLNLSLNALRQSFLKDVFRGVCLLIGLAFPGYGQYCEGKKMLEMTSRCEGLGCTPRS